MHGFLSHLPPHSTNNLYQKVWLHVEKSFSWISSNVIEKTLKEENVNNVPEELDGYQLERSAVDTPTVTHSVIEIRRPVNDQQESNT